MTKNGQKLTCAARPEGGKFGEPDYEFPARTVSSTSARRVDESTNGRLCTVTDETGHGEARPSGGIRRGESRILAPIKTWRYRSLALEILGIWFTTRRPREILRL